MRASSLQKKVTKLVEILSAGYDTWKDFVDDQQLGDCQHVKYAVAQMKDSSIKACFGYIRIKQPLEESDYNRQMTHHWITIDGKRFEFYKGSLRLYVAWDDEYGVYDDGEVSYRAGTTRSYKDLTHTRKKRVSKELLASLGGTR